MEERAAEADSGGLLPCWYMRRWINALVDGGLTGLVGWYARLHVTRCPQCRAAFEALLGLRERLRRLREIPAGGERLTLERRQALDAALNALDTGRVDP